MIPIQYGGKMTELRGVGAISVVSPSLDFVLRTSPSPYARACGTALWDLQPKIDFGAAHLPDSAACCRVMVNGKFEAGSKN